MDENQPNPDILILEDVSSNLSEALNQFTLSGCLTPYPALIRSEWEVLASGEPVYNNLFNPTSIEFKHTSKTGTSFIIKEEQSKDKKNTIRTISFLYNDEEFFTTSTEFQNNKIYCIDISIKHLEAIYSFSFYPPNLLSSLWKVFPADLTQQTTEKIQVFLISLATLNKETIQLYLMKAEREYIMNELKKLDTLHTENVLYIESLMDNLGDDYENGIIDPIEYVSKITLLNNTVMKIYYKLALQERLAQLQKDLGKE